MLLPPWYFDDWYISLFRNGISTKTFLNYFNSLCDHISENIESEDEYQFSIDIIKFFIQKK